MEDEAGARELHRQSGRSGDFVAINCGGVAEGVLQSELFGHARGAFSGAGAAREGLVAQASGGTLFLDEIGDAAPALHVAPLRLLQEREYRPVGADRPRKTDARFVAATLRPLEEQVTAGTFRPDLWTRLSRWIVRVPPLRERPEDIPELVAAFVERHAGRPLALAPGLLTALLRAPWPGNVRELDAVVERCVVASEGEPLELVAEVAGQLAVKASPAQEAPPRASTASKARPDREALVEAARLARGNLREAAKRLGVARSTYYRWLEEAGLDPAEVRKR